MKRRWFQDDDGTFYRNIPLIRGDQDRLINRLLPWRFWTLAAEWRHAWMDGVIETSRIGRRDVIAVPRPFREAYPNHPGLWRLDERREERRP